MNDTASARLTASVWSYGICPFAIAPRKPKFQFISLRADWRILM